MARTSRKAVKTQVPEPILKRQWNAGLYARLSAEDVASSSIEHQIALLNQYTRAQSGIRVVRTFTDHGETGTNFNRPGWKSLMEAVHRKEVNCILVKDFSRFGRNYLKTAPIWRLYFLRCALHLCERSI